MRKPGHARALGARDRDEGTKQALAALDARWRVVDEAFLANVEQLFQQKLAKVDADICWSRERPQTIGELVRVCKRQLVGISESSVRALQSDKTPVTRLFSDAITAQEDISKSFDRARVPSPARPEVVRQLLALLSRCI